MRASQYKELFEEAKSYIKSNSAKSDEITQQYEDLLGKNKELIDDYAKDNDKLRKDYWHERERADRLEKVLSN